MDTFCYLPLQIVQMYPIHACSFPFPHVEKRHLVLGTEKNQIAAGTVELCCVANVFFRLANSELIAVNDCFAGIRKLL